MNNPSRLLSVCEHATLLSFCLEEVPTIEALEFFHNLEDTEIAKLQTSIEGNSFEISDADLNHIFSLPHSLIHPSEYRMGEEKDIMKNILLRPADSHVTSGHTKPMLKRKYQLLYDIVQKVILGITFSPDQITLEKIRVMAATINRIPNLNWVGLLKHRLLNQQTKFKINEANKVVVYKKISLIHKTAMIMVDKLPNHEWDAQGM